MRVQIVASALGLLVVTAVAQTDHRQKQTPRVKSVSPAIGAEKVAPSLKEIRITFDLPMNRSGYSVVGGGPHFPNPAGPPQWVDAYTFAMPVNLKANWEYRFAINSPRHQNFRSFWLVPVEPMVCHFRTGGIKDIKRDSEAQRKINIDSFDALTDAMRGRYSYFELRKIGWEELFAEHRRDIVTQPTVEDWARRTARMLAAAGDVHLSLKLDGETIPTFVRRGDPGFHWAEVKKLIPSLQRVNSSVAAGKTEDNIAYILIETWDTAASRDIQAVQQRLAEYSGTRALVIDVRPNGGGSETLAKTVAAWFIDKPAVYAKHVYRRGPGPENFTPVRQRTIKPGVQPRRYTGPVAVLMGPANLSSCEAFLLMMKQASRATLIGQRSGGSSGNPAPVFLPNGVKVLIPSWKALTPDGVCIETVGITPDIHVPSTGGKFADGDPVLETALEHLRKAISDRPASPASGGGM